MSHVRTDRSWETFDQTQPLPKFFGPFPVPATAAAEAAWDVCTEFSPGFLVNHCARSFAWGCAFASAEAVRFDAEQLWVAAMLHDIALTPPFDSASLPFEEASGHVLGVFARAAGWPADVRSAMTETVVLHMRDDVSAEQHPEGHLLQFAVSLDVGGARREALDGRVVAEVLEALPRLGFNPAFTALMQDQARRKPGSAAAGLVTAGLADRIRANGFGS